MMKVVKVYRSLHNGVNIGVKSVIGGKHECCREASILKWLDHPNIIPFLGVSDRDLHLSYLITLWMDNGNVLEYINKFPEAKPLDLVGF